MTAPVLVGGEVWSRGGGWGYLRQPGGPADTLARLLPDAGEAATNSGAGILIITLAGPGQRDRGRHAIPVLGEHGREAEDLQQHQRHPSLGQII